MKIDQSRLFGLDLLRAIAVLLVLLAHTIPLLEKNHIITSISCFSALLGVEFFFVLSGFLIGSILIKVHNQEAITTFHSIKIFWVRRWFRTLPNYYLVLIVSVVLFYFATKQFIMGTSEGVLYLLFLQNFVSEFKSEFYGVSWSLAVEEWFYLLFPTFLFISQFIFPNKKKSFLYVISFFILVPLIVKVYLSCNNSLLEWDAGYRKIALLRLDAIGFGVLVAYINYYKKRFLENNKHLFFFLGIILFISLNIIFYYLFILKININTQKQHYNSSSFFLNTLFFTLMSFSISLLIPFFNNLKFKNTKSYIYRLVSFISLISYSIYLSHPLFIFFCTYINYRFNLSFSGLFLIILIWLVTIIGSYFQYTYFEVKLTALRDNFGRKEDRISIK